MPLFIVLLQRSIVRAINYSITTANCNNGSLHHFQWILKWHFDIFLLFSIIVAFCNFFLNNVNSQMKGFTVYFCYPKRKNYQILLCVKTLAICSATLASISLICYFQNQTLAWQKIHKKITTQPRNLKLIGNERELRYIYSSGKKNCPTIKMKK